MLIKQLIKVFDLLDSSTVTGGDVVNYLKGINPNANVETYPLVGPRSKTDMVKVRIPGTNGKAAGSSAPTIGSGPPGRHRCPARDDRLYLRRRRCPGRPDGGRQAVGYADEGRLPARRCVHLHPREPFAPTQPHDPGPFMNSLVDIYQINQEEVSPELDAILSVDTTKGNRVINTWGFALSQPVKEGWILRRPEEFSGREPISGKEHGSL